MSSQPNRQRTQVGRQRKGATAALKKLLSGKCTTFDASALWSNNCSTARNNSWTFAASSSSGATPSPSWPAASEDKPSKSLAKAASKAASA
eukprot:CAMPEP_0183554952 /NCGR_PEP_ID=MMETSP0371-20130417/79179_1 /TAXON_ID=268820 /ORGANISM="Peridinium aciculiferum, Strain PAER-2" /LENGTH=90 /DNA_ID=CAMNT_0025761009 /DNA_START=29 /DNA_END=297 /DNA_ORIENTATION=-